MIGLRCQEPIGLALGWNEEEPVSLSLHKQGTGCSRDRSRIADVCFSIRGPTARSSSVHAVHGGVISVGYLKHVGDMDKGR